MAWTWTFEPDTPDAEDPGEFTSQSDAESWLGEAWRALAEAGVIGVSPGARRREGLRPDAAVGVRPAQRVRRMRRSGSATNQPKARG